MNANILLDGRVVMSDVNVDIHVETTGRLKDWRGSFSVDHPSMLSQDDEYQLDLADGRSGRILITRESFVSEHGMTFIQFIGTGPLRSEDAD